MVTIEQEAQTFLTGLCVKHYQGVLRYLCHTLGDREAADDVAQEVFLTACARQQLLAQHPNPGGWLYQTAKNLACKHRRLAAVRLLGELSLDGDDPPPLADTQADIEAQLDNSIDETRYLDTLLASLGGEQQTLYRLYYLQGLTMAQVAARLGLAEATVRMRYVRLRRELRKRVHDLAEQEFSV